MPSKEIESERAVILDEIAMHSDDPGETAHELITGELLGSGLDKPVIGSPRSIRELTRSQIMGYWKRRYRPERLVITATGKVDHDHLVAQLSEYDALATAQPLSSSTSSRALSSSKGSRNGVTAGVDPVVLTRSRRFEQSTAVLATPGPGLFDEDRFPIGLLSIIVGGGMASRLFVEVRERRGLAYGIEAGETSYSDAGLWSVDWQCAPDRVAEILTLVRRCLADLAEHGVTDEELARAKGQLAGQTVLSFEGPQSRMSRLGTAELLGDPRSVADLLTAYDTVTAEDVRRVAADLFHQRQVLAVVGPTTATRPLRRALTA
jgi:predicted Zn-dependent peptidase